MRTGHGRQASSRNSCVLAPGMPTASKTGQLAQVLVDCSPARVAEAKGGGSSIKNVPGWTRSLPSAPPCHIYEQHHTLHNIILHEGLRREQQTTECKTKVCRKCVPQKPVNATVQQCNLHSIAATSRVCECATAPPIAPPCQVSCREAHNSAAGSSCELQCSWWPPTKASTTEVQQQCCTLA